MSRLQASRMDRGFIGFSGAAAARGSILEQMRAIAKPLGSEMRGGRGRVGVLMAAI